MILHSKHHSGLLQVAALSAQTPALDPCRLGQPPAGMAAVACQLQAGGAGRRAWTQATVFLRASRGDRAQRADCRWRVSMHASVVCLAEAQAKACSPLLGCLHRPSEPQLTTLSTASRSPKDMIAVFTCSKCGAWASALLPCMHLSISASEEPPSYIGESQAYAERGLLSEDSASVQTRAAPSPSAGRPTRPASSLCSAPAAPRGTCWPTASAGSARQAA